MPRDLDQLKALNLPELGITLEALTARLEAVTAEIKALKDAHKDYAHKYTKAQRATAYAAGLVHSEEEAEALAAILNSADAFPALVEPLARQDHGEDEAAFETDLLAARLEAVHRLQLAAKAAQSLSDQFSDTAAALGNRSKPVIKRAYTELRPASNTRPTLSSLLAKAIDFFRSQHSNRKK